MNSDFDKQEILKRLLVLEKRQARFKGLLFLLLTFGGVAFLAGAKSSRPLTAEAILIQDASGKTSMRLDSSGIQLFDPNGILRASLTVKGNAPLLMLYDAKKVNRAEMVVDASGPRIALADASEASREILGADDKGPYLKLGDASHKMRILLDLHGDDTQPEMVLYDSAGTPRNYTYAREDAAGFQLSNSSGKQRAIFFAENNGRAALQIRDSDATIESSLEDNWFTMYSHKGIPGLEIAGGVNNLALYDWNGNKRIDMSGHMGPMLNFYDTNETVVWTAH